MGRLYLIAMVVALVGIAFAITALNVAWGTSGEPQFFEIGYSTHTVHAYSDGDLVESEPYSSAALDDSEGIGLARAGGLLWLLGTIFAGLGWLAIENHLLLPKVGFQAAGAGGLGLGFLVMLIGLILLPIGIARLSEDAGFGDLGWGFGLAAAIIATVCVLAAAIMAIVEVVGDTGFRLELADAPRADFD